MHHLLQHSLGLIKKDFKDGSVTHLELCEFIAELNHWFLRETGAPAALIVHRDKEDCLSASILTHPDHFSIATISGFFRLLTAVSEHGKDIVTAVDKIKETEDQFGFGKSYRELANQYILSYRMPFPVVIGTDDEKKLMLVALPSNYLEQTPPTLSSLLDYLEDFLREASSNQRDPLPGQPSSKWDSRTGGPKRRTAQSAFREALDRATRGGSSRPDQDRPVQRASEGVPDQAPGSTEGVDARETSETEERERHEDPERFEPN